MRTLVILMFCFFCEVLHAQIVNIQSLRRETNTTGWSGHASLQFGLKQNNINQIFDIQHLARIEYKWSKSTYFFVNDFQFKEINKNMIANYNTQHFRYNYAIRPKYSLESFLQSQRNKISEIKLRTLIGLGVRFRIYDAEKQKIYFGTNSMYEYENAENDATPIQHNLRGSNYLSIKLTPNEKVTIISTNYYQPLFKELSDFRFLSQSSILVNIFNGIQFMSTFYMNYDSNPVINVRKTQYNFTNGIAYTF